MSFHVDRFVGNVTNIPEVKTIGQKNTALKELVLAANASKKNRETQKYEPVLDKNGKQKVSWLVVKLWGERAHEDFVKGDLVEFKGSVQEEYFERRDGTEGRRLESDYVESVIVKYPSRDRGSKPTNATADAGFVPAPSASDGFASVGASSGIQAAADAGRGF